VRIYLTITFRPNVTVVNNDTGHFPPNPFQFGLYKMISLSVVLYECKTWSLTLKEEHRPGVSENRVLRRIFGPKRDEVTVE
jgi:hypothetical protein